MANIDLGVEVLGVRDGKAKSTEPKFDDPYVRPKSDLEANPFLEEDPIRLGFTGVIICLFHILASAVVLLLSAYAIYLNRDFDSILFIGCIVLVSLAQLFAYLLLLLRRNSARRAVLIFSALETLAFPVGTIVGGLMISKIRGKKF